MPWHAAQGEEIRQNVDDIARLQLAGHTDRQALVCEPVGHVEHPELPAVAMSVLIQAPKAMLQDGPFQWGRSR